MTSIEKKFYRNHPDLFFEKYFDVTFSAWDKILLRLYSKYIQIKYNIKHYRW